MRCATSCSAASITATASSAADRRQADTWIPVREEQFAVRHLLDAGYAVLGGERFRLRTPPAVRVTTAQLQPAAVEQLAATLVEAATGRTLISA
jgi:hypothetical protein